MSQIVVAWSRGNQRSQRAEGLRGRSTGAEVAAVAFAFAGLALAPASVTQTAQAALVASWNLNSLEAGGGAAVPASIGSGSLDLTGLGTGVSVMLGTTLGAQPGEAAGNALAVVGTLYNQASFRIDIDANGLSDVALSFATRRSTTGFSANRIEYWAGLGWGTLASFGASTTAWELQTYSLASLTSVSSGYLTLRFVLDGATGSTGSIRFDNFAVTGTPVPASGGALALFCAAGAVSRRRRR